MNYLTLHICYIFKQFGHNKSIFLLSIPLILSFYTHLWNPIGFPAVWVVEGQYINRAMHILEGLDSREPKTIHPHLYDHPYFGGTFLAAVFNIIGYPELLKASPSIH